MRLKKKKKNDDTLQKQIHPKKALASCLDSKFRVFPSLIIAILVNTSLLSFYLIFYVTFLYFVTQYFLSKFFKFMLMRFVLKLKVRFHLNQTLLVLIIFLYLQCLINMNTPNYFVFLSTKFTLNRFLSKVFCFLNSNQRFIMSNRIFQKFRSGI